MLTTSLEFDTPRAGSFEPLQYLPPSKTAILGVVTSKNGKLEDKAKMVGRVHEAADHVAKGSNESREQALKRLGVSTQWRVQVCSRDRLTPHSGFASHAEGNPLTVRPVACSV